MISYIRGELAAQYEDKVIVDVGFHRLEVK